MAVPIKLSPGARADVTKCFHCGLCLAWCPTFEATRNESWGARGRMLLVRVAAEGRPIPMEGLLNRVYSCPLCKACEVSCPLGVRVTDVLGEVRAELARRGLAPLAEQRPIVEGIRTFGNAFGERELPAEIRAITAGLPREAENAVYLGCVASYNYTRLAESFLRCLLKANVSFTVVEGPCCGGPQRLCGLEEGEGFANRCIEAARATGARRVVALCPMCYAMLKGRGIEVVHAVDALDQLIGRGELRLERELNLSHALHDPCHLGRYAGLYDAARRVLLSVPKLKLKEMRHNRDKARCCGGPIRVPFVKLRNAMCEASLREASRLRVDGLSTACPTCFHNLRTVSARLRVFHLCELVGYSAGVVDELPLYRKPYWPALS